MKKLILIATIVILVALALPAAVSAADQPVTFTGNIQGCPTWLTLAVVDLQNSAWMWPYASQDNERLDAMNLQVTMPDCTYKGYQLTVKDTEPEKVGAPTAYAGYFGQYTMPSGPWVLPSEGGKVLFSPLRVYNVSVNPITGLPDEKGGPVSSYALDLFSPDERLNPGIPDLINIHLKQNIGLSYDQAVPPGYSYRIVLTFTATPN